MLVMSIASACLPVCPKSAWAFGPPDFWWTCCVVLLWSICGALVLLCCSCRSS